uniref:Histamine H2 receptor n=1 Tax=Denticeps clupeoides TaxID=299321 RepID=A0AAY4A4I3_9TELE
MLSTALTCLALVAFILMTIGGNVLVCLAVGTSRRLHRISNCFVVSLAVTDLLLGLLVLPTTALLELRNGHWPLGGALCNIYITVDVMLCTASIFNLLAISIDRYLAISSPMHYMERVTPPRVAAAIAVIWVLSLALSILPVHLGWNTKDFRVQYQDWHIGDTKRDDWNCRYEWSNIYVLVNCFITFYIPLVVMCGTYLCIFRVARKQAQRIRAALPSLTRSSPANFTMRDYKATVTLAAVLGGFIVCWFPYFTFFIWMGLRNWKETPEIVHSVVLWLGYFNSVLNPIIYPSLNRDFRRAYSQLLCCRGSNQRNPPSLSCVIVYLNYTSIICGELNFVLKSLKSVIWHVNLF